MRNFFIAGIFLLASSAEAAVNTPWRDFSNPSIMSSTFERSFEKLPLHGAPNDTQKLWANDYWPRKRGIINYRWNAKKPTGFDLVSPTKAEALRMSQAEIAALAPSEKLDLLNGNYDYPLVKEVDQRSSPYAPLWHGICNGWSPAAINHNEPLPKSLVNPDGIIVPFGSSDIKGLISYYYAYKHEVSSTHQMGKRCNLNFGPNCDDDLNAGAFHIVLTNKVGLEQSSFVADVEGNRQVWNHAVNEYVTTIVNDGLAPESDSASGTVKRVRVKTVMTFVLKMTENNWEPVLGTDSHVNEVRNYEYFLELDAAGRIIGGEWISNARPDFLWTMEKATNFDGMFVRLPELLND
ncbi:MAG: hypothetical protein NDI69_10735 [Bacteriovoracaceae bacterium]|nr:hypothetical protein [Bacteriovoracaceae bacterium]